jgi:hypothetical protein
MKQQRSSDRTRKVRVLPPEVQRQEPWQAAVPSLAARLLHEYGQ